MTVENNAEYVLFWGPDMGSLPIQALLIELDLPHRLVQVNFGNMDHRNPEFLAINPVGKIPALRLPNGEVMTESAAMLIYLADLKPASGLLPSMDNPDRAQALRWLLFIATEMYPTVCRYYSPELVIDGDDAMAKISLKAKQVFHDQCLFLEQQMNENQLYFLGNRYSVVDLYLSTMLEWHDDKAALARDCPHLWAISKHVHTRRAVMTARETHQMTE